MISFFAQAHVMDGFIRAFPYSIRAMDDTWGRLPLHIACICAASAQVLLLLLAEFPESTRCPDKQEGRLPVHYACLYGSPFEISVLVEAEKRALVYKDASGKTPLDIAHASNNPHREAILKRLEDKTARVTESMKIRRRRESLESATTSNMGKKKSSKQESKRGLSVGCSSENVDVLPPILNRKKSSTRRRQTLSKDGSNKDDVTSKQLAELDDIEKRKNTHPSPILPAGYATEDIEKDLQQERGEQEGYYFDRIDLMLDTKEASTLPRTSAEAVGTAPALPGACTLPSPLGPVRSYTVPVNGDGKQRAKSERRIRTSLPGNISDNVLHESTKEKRRSSKKLSAHSKADAKSARRVSELLQEQSRSERLAQTPLNHSATDAFEKTPRQRNSRKLETFLLMNTNDQPSPEQDVDHKSLSVKSLPAQHHSHRTIESLPIVSEPSTDVLVSRDNTLGNTIKDETIGNKSSDTSDSVLEIVCKEKELIKLEAQLRNLDVRKEALSQECTHLYKSVANKQDDVDRTREKILFIQRKIAEYQSKLEKEQSTLELAVTSIEIQRETLSEHEAKMDFVETDRKILFAKKEQLLSERNALQVVAKEMSPRSKAFSISTVGVEYPVFEI